MAKITKYGLGSLRRDFPNERRCLEYIFDALHSRECSCGGTYALIQGRRQFQCSRCRFQIAPTAGTIFHKSDTQLTLWFHAIWVFSNAKSGISAKEMERQLGVTYKTAWRILHLIRKALGHSGDKLSGTVELDSTKFGGRGPVSKRNEKLTLMAAVERQGEIRAEVVPDETAKTHERFLKRHVKPEGTMLMTDKSRSIHTAAIGYDRQTVNHMLEEYVRGDVHTNTVDSFWAHVKRSLKGTYKSVSKQHFQGYLDAYSFHWNNSYNDRRRFSVLLGTVLLSAK